MRIVVSLLGIFAAMGCGEKPPPEKPFIVTDVASLGFDTQFASGTFIGRSPINSLTVMNEGLTDLIISDVVQSGDSAFSYLLQGQMPGDPPSSVLPITVKGKQNTFIQFTFTPTDTRRYSGAVNVKSNADNIKDLPIALFGCGIRQAADGGTPELPDGGCGN
jgi:hypothetical protein